MNLLDFFNIVNILYDKYIYEIVKAPPQMELENPPPQLRGKSLHLPQKLIELILVLLPVKSLLKFKCVSKEWRRLIGSDRFIKLQLQKSREDKIHWRVIFGYREAGLKQCSMVAYNGVAPIDPYPVEGPINSEHPVPGNVVGSINGVLCIRGKLGCFSLYNPSTRILHELPEIDKAVGIDGFGWDETTDAYKVFAVVLGSYNNRLGQLYSSKTNSWKTVGPGSVSSLFRMTGFGAGAGGKIHWLSEGRQRIESFDLKSELFEATELPFKPDYRASMWVCETGGCIGVVVVSKMDKLCDTWTMKEYGVKESWVKEVRCLPQRKITDRYGGLYCIDSLVSPLFDKEKEENVEEEPRRRYSYLPLIYISAFLLFSILYTQTCTR